jgi:hypothetical protein
MRGQTIASTMEIYIKVQFGFEITSSSGGLNFTSNSYSAMVN